MKSKKVKKKIKKKNLKKMNTNHKHKKINLCKSEFQYDMWPGFLND